MNIVFRVDAAVTFGSGHVRRCLSLGQALQQQGATVSFITQPRQGDLIDLIIANSFQVHLLPTASENDEYLMLGVQQDAQETCQILASESDVDWLIVDHYGIGQDWLRHVRPHAKKIMMIDDLANRWINADILLDQNYGRIAKDYQSYVNDSCELLLGSEYALLRPEFAIYRDSVHRSYATDAKQICISFGGVDRQGFTSIVLRALAELSQTVTIDVVLGAGCAHINEIEKLIVDLKLPAMVYVNTDKVASVMAVADLAIGAGGTTNWERCCLGLPTLLFVVAENQRTIAAELAKAGAVSIVAEEKMYDIEYLKNQLSVLLSDRIHLKDMSQCAAALCDGQGTARVVSKLFSTKASINETTINC